MKKRLNLFAKANAGSHTSRRAASACETMASVGVTERSEVTCHLDKKGLVKNGLTKPFFLCNFLAINRSIIAFQKGFDHKFDHLQITKFLLILRGFEKIPLSFDYSDADIEF